jgi:hypothetical protein
MIIPIPDPSRRTVPGGRLAARKCLCDKGLGAITHIVDVHGVVEAPPPR